MSENSGSLGLSMSLRQNIAEQTRAASQGVEQLNKTMQQGATAAEMLAQAMLAEGKSVTQVRDTLLALGQTTEAANAIITKYASAAQLAAQGNEYLNTSWRKVFESLNQGLPSAQAALERTSQMTTQFASATEALKVVQQDEWTNLQILIKEGLAYGDALDILRNKYKLLGDTVSGVLVKMNQPGLLRMRTSPEEATGILANIRLYEQLPTKIAGANTALQQFNTTTGLHMKMLPQEAQAIARNIELYNGLAGASGKAAGGIHSMWSQSFLFFGIAMGVNSAVQQLAAATGEKANPALMQLGRIMQEVSSGAMVGMMMTQTLAGMLGGALIGALAGVALSLATVDPQMVELNKQLDSIGRKDDAVQSLAKLSGVEYAVADAALEFAKAHKDATPELRALIDEAKTAIPVFTGLEKVIRDNAKAWGDIFNDPRVRAGLRSSLYTRPFAEWMDEQDRLQREAEQRSAPLEAETKRLAYLKQLGEYQKEATKLLEDYNQEAADQAEENYRFAIQSRDAFNQRTQDLIRANQTYTDSVFKANRDLQDRLNDLADEGRIKGIESTQSRERIERDTNENIARIAQDLADRETDIAQNKSDKLTDLAYNHAEKEKDFAHDIAREQIRLNDEVYKIYRSLGDDLEDESYRKAEQLQKAKTWQEVLEINKRDEHEKRIIGRRKDEREYDTNLSSQRSREETDYRIRLSDDEYTHNIQLSIREVEQQISQAQRSNREQLGLSRQRNQNQLADFNNRIALEEMRSELQVSQTKRRNQEQLSDLAARLGQERSQIDLRYNSEIFKMDEAHNHWILLENDKVNKLLGDMRLLESQYPSVVGVGGFAGVGTSLGTAGVRMANGGEGVVPPGFPNDSFPLWLTSGEKYKVETPNQTPSQGSPNITIQINAPVYGVEDLEGAIQHGVRQGLARYNTGR